MGQTCAQCCGGIDDLEFADTAITEESSMSVEKKKHKAWSREEVMMIVRVQSMIKGWV